MRSFTSIRPETGSIPYNVARDLAWCLADVWDSDVVLALGSGPDLDPVLRLLAAEIKKRDATLFRRLHIIQTHEAPEFGGGRVRCQWHGIEANFTGPAITAGDLTLEQVHRLSFSGGPLFEAIEYSALLNNLGGQIHAALLSVGGGVYNSGGVADAGSIAGIFPGNTEIWKDVTGLFAAVTEAPKPPGTWVTVTPTLLRQAEFIAAVLMGEEKRPTFNRMFMKVNVEDCPARLLSGPGQAEVKLYHDIETP